MQVRMINPIWKNDFGANLLRYRGVEDIDWYLKPTEPKYLQDPEALDNIIEGGKRLMATIEVTKKKFLLIVDCDNDGFTSAAIIYGYIKKIRPDLEIDYWLHEGKAHGLEDHINHLLEVQDEYDLVIIPDASSNDYEFFEKLDIMCLVIDHHLAEPPYSEKSIIINNQLSDNYINKELTGAGVVWQFCRYMDKTYGYNFADDFIDLAAWGIIGDMGSVLSYENRYIIYHGLQNVKNFFFRALIDKQNYSMGGKLNPISIAFYIVPLTNAMIRVGTMEEKKRLFEAYIEGEKLIPSGKRGAKGTLEYAAVESARECTNARTHQNKAKDTMVAKLEEKIYKYDLLSNKILFVRLDEDDTFPSELVGLVAMQLSAEFKKPTLVGRLNKEGYDRGSIRGVNQSALVSLKDYLESTGMFEYVQGHDNAAGFSIKDDYLSDFHKRANEDLKDIDFGESVYDVNFECIAADTDFINRLVLDLSNYSDIWGQNSDEPLLYVKALHITKNNINICGKNNDTVQIKKDGITYVKFHAKDFIQELNEFSEMVIDIVGKPNLNEWQGNYSSQVLIENYEIKRDSILDF